MMVDWWFGFGIGVKRLDGVIVFGEEVDFLMEHVAVVDDFVLTLIRGHK